VRVVREIRRNGDDLEFARQILRPVIDEEDTTRAEREVCRQVAALGIAALLREIAVDEVIHLKLLGPSPGVGVPAGAPEQYPGAVDQEMEELPCSRPE
jgi:hypothetical protein